MSSPKLLPNKCMHNDRKNLAALAADDARRSVTKWISYLIDGLCDEAGMMNERESARGEDYSIAEYAILEYAAWYNMPWEDY